MKSMKVRIPSSLRPTATVSLFAQGMCVRGETRGGSYCMCEICAYLRISLYLLRSTCPDCCVRV